MIPVITNLLSSNSKPHLKCVGGGWGLNVCVGGGGGKFGTYSILHMFLSCNCSKIFYCISLQHSCELTKFTDGFSFSGRIDLKTCRQTGVS